MTDPMKTASERLDELLGPKAKVSMTTIPGDIIDSALALAGDLASTPCPTAKLTLIRNAIMAERARCALIANSHREGDKSLWRAPPFNDGCDFTARYIEKAIIEGGRP